MRELQFWFNKEFFHRATSMISCFSAFYSLDPTIITYSNACDSSIRVTVVLEYIEHLGVITMKTQ